MQHYIYDVFFSHKKNDWLFYLIQGLLIALIGLIILLVPEILIVFIAMIFFTIGSLLIAFALRLRRNRNSFYEIEIK